MVWFCLVSQPQAFREPEVALAASRPSQAVVKGNRQGGQLSYGLGTSSPKHFCKRPGQEEQLHGTVSDMV